MPKGISLHIGLNSVDPAHYSGWSGDLAACEADADDMEAIAKGKKFSATKLLTRDGTRDRVVAEIQRAASSLDAGDIFFLTYSGHGGQLPDRNGDEADRLDETWCLFDGQIVDDELHALYARFKKGVRIFVLSDSCHSGTVTKMAFYQGTLGARSATPDAPAVRYRNMPLAATQKVYRQNKKFYDAILDNPALREAKSQVQATILLISGSMDNQLSSDGTFNGLFTGTLLQVWNNGTYKNDYRAFHRSIVRRMPPDQTPHFSVVGTPSPAFEKQRPFTI